MALTINRAHTYEFSSHYTFCSSLCSAEICHNYEVTFYTWKLLNSISAFYEFSVWYIDPLYKFCNPKTSFVIFLFLRIFHSSISTLLLAVFVFTCNLFTAFWILLSRSVSRWGSTNPFPDFIERKFQRFL